MVTNKLYKRPLFKTSYDERDRSRYQTQIIGESLTEQSHKDECDVNLIVKQYQRTGVVTHLSSIKADYGDVEAIDLQSALETVEKAETAFNQLPSKLRKHFNNDSISLLTSISDPSPEDTLILEEFGFIDKPPKSTSDPSPNPPSDPSPNPPSDPSPKAA